MKKLFSSFILSLCLLFISANANAQFIVAGTAGGTLDGLYTSLTNPLGLFAALNGGPPQGGAIITVSQIAPSILETGLNPLLEGLWTSLTITPVGPMIISGLVGPVELELIDLNGADNVTIDGLGTGGSSLTITNLSVDVLAGTSTIRFINGASDNTITNCTILGSSLNLLGIPGGTIFFSTDASLGALGNDDNEISDCDIGPATATLPFKAIFSLGSVTTPVIRNSGNLIDNNNIFDFFGTGLTSTAGINILAGNDDWTISNNRLYQTVARVFTVAAQRYSGITLNDATSPFPGAFLVSGNTIGFATAAGAGVTATSGSSNEFRGIDAISVSTTTSTLITENTISGITQASSRASTALASSVFVGVSMGTFNGLIDATFNNIGSLDGSSTIVLTLSSVTASTTPVMGLFNFSFFNTTISNNKIGSITITGAGTRGSFRGIYVNTATSPIAAIVNDNTISNITNTQVGGYAMLGIRIDAADATVINDTVRNMTGSANGAGSIHMEGIQVLFGVAPGVNNIEKNVIFNLNNTAGVAFGAIYGIDVLLPETANEIKQNYVYGLSATSTSTAYQLWGIIRRTTTGTAAGLGGSATVYNNMISLGLRTDGTSITTGFSIIGIRDPANASGIWNYYYNSIFIGGSGVVSGSSSFGIFSDVAPNTRNFVNNILWNDRGNTVAGGFGHFAISVGGSPVVDPPGLTSDYNDLFASGIDGAVGFYGVTQLTLLAWQTATGQDDNSSSVTVDFVDEANGNLHLSGASVGDEDFIATPIAGITTDIDKQLRDPVFPYMGADEGPTALPVELASFTSSISGRDVTLNWTTTSELNNAGFDVERSMVNDQWSMVGNVSGNGTSTTPHNYSYTDRSLSSGSYNYRLKQIDLNGNFTYYDLSNEVNIGVPTKFDLSQNYPNPFNPTTKINYDLPFDAKVNIKIFDMSGREVATLVNEVKTAGYYTLNFNGSNLSSGVYFYRINAEANGQNFVSTKKMMLVK